MKIVFFGTPEFGVESLDRLIKAGKDIAAVVTAPDKVGGRGHKLIESDVKKYAMQAGLKILQPANLKSEEFLSELREINADLFIVIAFRMLPQSVWQMPPLGTFNLHASLLPAYRGAAPINWAVINGEKETGVTTFFLKHEIDTGDIIEQRKVEIMPGDNVGDVYDKLMRLGAEMVVETVDRIETGEVKTMPQPEGNYKMAPKIFKTTCQIRWEASNSDIHNLVRGLSPYPGAWTMFSDARSPEKLTELKIFETVISDYPEHIVGKAGRVGMHDNRLFVKTGDGFIEIKSLQPSGKKRMTAEEFIRGYKPIEFK